MVVSLSEVVLLTVVALLLPSLSSPLPTEQDLGKTPGTAGESPLQRGELLGRGSASFCETLSFIAVQARTDLGRRQPRGCVSFPAEPAGAGFDQK